MKHLSSRHHPLVAACRAVARGRHDQASRLLLDGPHLLMEALASGVAIEVAVLAERLLSVEEGERLQRTLDAAGVETLSASQTVIDALSPASTPSGVVAIAVRPGTSLARVLARAPQLLVVALDVQDPGNVGAIIRAAEAGGATGVVLGGASADPFGWKALRGSMGSALRVPLVHGLPFPAVAGAIRDAGARVLAAVVRGASSAYESDLAGPVAFLLGGEGPGLASDAVAASDAAVAIPMAPPVESLNVAVAAALLVYEARRQRGWATASPPGGPDRSAE
ncbi:MAG TPA: RNA methyltransferase [Vicinamibacterales bacterium]|nr:RNA methyltransferase [Vicinamibacterales bacterium]